MLHQHLLVTLKFSVSSTTLWISCPLKLRLFSVCPALDMLLSQHMSAEWINVMIPRCQCWALIKPLEKTEMPLVLSLKGVLLSVTLCILSHNLTWCLLLPYLGQSRAVALHPPVQRTDPAWFLSLRSGCSPGAVFYPAWLRGLTLTPQCPSHFPCTFEAPINIIKAAMLQDSFGIHVYKLAWNHR